VKGDNISVSITCLMHQDQNSRESIKLENLCTSYYLDSGQGVNLFRFIYLSVDQKHILSRDFFFLEDCTLLLTKTYRSYMCTCGFRLCCYFSWHFEFPVRIPTWPQPIIGGCLHGLFKGIISFL
jgi:hypothetical protein